jgi:pimeloyl-ACP methyl ester carboxylesterase
MFHRGAPPATIDPSMSSSESSEVRGIELRGANDLRLRGDQVGREGDPLVLLLHGGGQTRHAWGNTARALAAQGFHVIALDHRGHGDSEWGDDYGLSVFADDVVAICKQLAQPPILVGASLGGLAGLLAEAEQGPLLKALVLVDVGPRLAPSGVQKIIGFMKSGLDGFASLEEAADTIAAYMPHRPRPRDTRGLAKNLRQGPDGRWRWHWDPRFVERRGPDTSFRPERLTEAARKLKLPVQLVRGHKSDVLPEDAVKEFLEMVPHARFDSVDAHHMVAGDDNDAFTDTVRGFLAEVAR